MSLQFQYIDNNGCWALAGTLAVTMIYQYFEVFVKEQQDMGTVFF